MKEIKYPYLLNLQLFADGGEDDKDNEPSEKHSTNQQIEIDYEKLAQAINGRKQVAGDAALKNYLKEQGLSDKQLDDAVRMYKENETKKAKDEEDRIQKIIKENEAYKANEAKKIIEKNATEIAKELNIRDDRINTVLKLVDTSKYVDKEGAIDREGIKKAFSDLLKELPEFAQKKQITITKGRTYQGNNPENETDEEAYRRKKYGKNKYYKG